eukprot:g355.t1
MSMKKKKKKSQLRERENTFSANGVQIDIMTFSLNTNTTMLWDEVMDELEDLGTTNAVLLILVGIVLMGIGKRLVPLGVFVAGFAASGYAAFALFIFIANQTNLSIEDVSYGALGTGIALGLIGGLIAVKFVSWGFFLFGFGAGSSLGFYLQHIFFAGVLSKWSIPDYAPYIVVIALGIIGGIFMAWMREKIFAVVTSFLGAFCITQGWVYFASYPKIPELLDNTSSMDQQIWIEIVSVVLLTFVGSAYQMEIRRSRRLAYTRNSARMSDPLLEDRIL